MKSISFPIPFCRRWGACPDVLPRYTQNIIHFSFFPVPQVLQQRHYPLFRLAGRMHEQVTEHYFRANTSPNALQNSCLQIRPCAGSPLRAMDPSRPCVGPDSMAGGCSITTAEAYPSLPPGHRKALNTPNQACLDGNFPRAPDAIPNRERSTHPEDIKRGGVARGSRVGQRSENTAQKARRPHGNPPVPRVLSPRAPNAPSISQLPWQASHHSFGHPQMNPHQQSIHPVFAPHSLTSLPSGFTLHPSVEQEPPYHLHQNQQARPQRPRHVRILPWNWTPADPLPQGLCMSMLWNHLASAYIPHIYPQRSPWRNVSGDQIDFALWGAPLNLSGDPPQWLSEDIDLGAPLIALPSDIDVQNYEYDTMATYRLLVGTKPFYRFDPGADAGLDLTHEDGKLETLEMSKELQICTKAIGEQASPPDCLGGSSSCASHYNNQLPTSGPILDAGIVGTKGYRVSANGNIDALVGPKETTINLCESQRKPATPAGLLGVNPRIGQWEHPDPNSYTGHLRQSVPTIRSRFASGDPPGLQKGVPAAITNFLMPPRPIAYPAPTMMPPSRLDNFTPFFLYPMQPLGTQYPEVQGCYPMAQPPNPVPSYRPPPYWYRGGPVVDNSVLRVPHNMPCVPGTGDSTYPQSAQGVWHL